MRLFPKSLLWRAFLLIATLMLLAVAAWLAIFREAEIEPRARQIAQMVSSVANLTRAALLAARPAHRRSLLSEISETEGLRVYPADPDDEVRPLPPTPLSFHLVRELRERLGPETRLAFVLNGDPGLFVSFRIFPGDAGEYWLALPRERLERRLPWQWLGWGAAVLLLALAGAWLIVLRITRPLRILEKAAHQVGAGETPPPLPETGPEEIVAVTAAFNRMSANLARLEEDRTLLLAGISHDLRTPLTRLRMETELSVADEQARNAMDADITEMDRTIGQFLDFARPGDAPAASVDIDALLADIAGRYTQRVTYTPPGPNWPARRSTELPVRSQALRRAVTNLIENALRHGGMGPDGTTPIDVQLLAVPHEIVIAVLDRGPGIAPADAERLKQPFTRGESARTGASGAGLGLAIVDRIARSHGGRLDLLPREGGGLAARICLPA
jgi:two-component system osmolarity sensor histidine kinase EnvZ